MYYQDLSEKPMSMRGVRRCSNISAVANMLCQHILLWSSLYVLISGVYMLLTLRLDPEVIAATIVAVIAATMSIGYMVPHTIVAFSSVWMYAVPRSESRRWLNGLALVCLATAFLTWVAADTLLITFTLARQPSCLPGGKFHMKSINTGRECYIQRSSVATSLLALATCGTLCKYALRSSNPWRCHLFGRPSAHHRISTLLPYPYPSCDGYQLPYSELSFKCRSSTSLSSKTLVPSISSTATLLPPAKAHRNRLSKSPPKISGTKHSFLAPRPSLSSIRSSCIDSTSTYPPSSLLPPLPAYFSDHCRSASELSKAVSLRPKTRAGCRLRTVRLVTPPEQIRSMRCVPPSPTMQSAGTAGVGNSSMVSLGSVYSQDVQGRRVSKGWYEMPGSSGVNGQASLDCAAAATSEVQSFWSPLRLITPSEDAFEPPPAGAVGHVRATSDIDDAAALQARLPHVRTVSTFGDVEKWACGSQTAATYYQRLIRSRRQHSTFRSGRFGKGGSSASANSFVT